MVDTQHDTLAGNFEPLVPHDAQAVVRAFAIAARHVCVWPDKLALVDQTLSVLTAELVPPEASAARECRRLWNTFVTAFPQLKPAQRELAAGAFYGRLESVGQQHDLPPMPEWNEVPTTVTGLQPLGFIQDPRWHEDLSLDAVRSYAATLASHTQGRVLPNDVARLLAGLRDSDRLEILRLAVGRGLMSRSDIALLQRWLARSEAIGREDTVLLEVLERLGAWLVQRD